MAVGEAKVKHSGKLSGAGPGQGKRNHTPPCPSEELFFAEKMGAIQERFRW